MLKKAQYIIALALIWAFMPIIEDLIMVVARFFFRVADLLHLIPNIF